LLLDAPVTLQIEKQCGQMRAAVDRRSALPADDDDWAVGVRRAVLAHRAEEHAGELAMTPAADDEEVGAL
jgi:hypothetical protein